jgi:hypothetical protein
MKQTQKQMERPQFLSGWKEIAAYLGKGVRTTQRYERDSGLPVRRPAGKPSGSVIATKAELDGWVKASPIREIFHLRNPEPERAAQTRALQRRMMEMEQLRKQMIALRSEVRKSVDLLHNSIHELQHTLRPPVFDGSSLFSKQERELVDDNMWETKAALPGYPKAS